MADVPPLETRLSAVLASGRVEMGLVASDVDDAAEKLLLPLLKAQGLSDLEAAAGIEAVKYRERTGSTSLGNVALPHARLISVNRIIGALGVNRSGVFRNGCGDAVQLVLAFVSPTQSAVAHLKFLGSVAQVLRQEGIIGQISEAASPDAVLSAIRSRER